MKALVVFSGGQDSTTCLGWAKNRYSEVEVITFIYGQRHEIEVAQARIIAKKEKVPIKLINVNSFTSLVISALTGEGDINAPHEVKKELPASYVPNRNAMFLTMAHAYAQTIGARVIITGVCQTDYSGYPDCRRSFISAIDTALNLGSEEDIQIITPLMYLTKAETFQLARNEGILDTVLALSHTCYNGKQTLHDWGMGCGDCSACKLRKKGYKTFLKQLL